MNREDAEYAVKTLDGKDLRGQSVRVAISAGGEEVRVEFSPEITGQCFSSAVPAVVVWIAATVTIVAAMVAGRGLLRVVILMTVSVVGRHLVVTGLLRGTTIGTVMMTGAGHRTMTVAGTTVAAGTRTPVKVDWPHLLRAVANVDMSASKSVLCSVYVLALSEILNLARMVV